MQKIKKEFCASIIKIDENEEKQVVTGIVLEPDTRDSQGDIISAEEIEKAAYYFMETSRTIGDSHKRLMEAIIVENYLAPVNFSINETSIKQGTWIMSVKIMDDHIWEMIKNYYYTGFSVGGYGIREVEK